MRGKKQAGTNSIGTPRLCTNGRVRFCHMRGDTPVRRVKLVENEPRLSNPTSKQTSVEPSNGRVTELKRFSEAPQMPHPNKNEILHGRVEADGIRIMASDGKKDVREGRISLSLEFTDNAELDHVFAKLSAGGTVTMPV